MSTLRRCVSKKHQVQCQTSSLLSGNLITRKKKLFFRLFKLLINSQLHHDYSIKYFVCLSSILFKLFHTFIFCPSVLKSYANTSSWCFWGRQPGKRKVGKFIQNFSECYAKKIFHDVGDCEWLKWKLEARKHKNVTFEYILKVFLVAACVSYAFCMILNYKISNIQVQTANPKCEFGFERNFCKEKKVCIFFRCTNWSKFSVSLCINFSVNFTQKSLTLQKYFHALELSTLNHT